MPDSASEIQLTEDTRTFSSVEQNEEAEFELANNLGNFRLPYIFLNNHSVNVFCFSFDVQDVFCFITVSNPPRMGPLMIFKVSKHWTVKCHR